MMIVINHILHVLAYALLHIQKPQRAKTILDQIGKLLPPLDSSSKVEKAVRTLWGGTCLSRALTIAARTPKAEVIIGVNPPGPTLAHAWVEIEGIAVTPTDPKWQKWISLKAH
ncbi:lasso peptide biosynthesis B2 protein [Pajaroellobacter abortibovis]|uniref:Microcin J25-processing protein McjB C-terminal domain-containing protein n=1 Tax=Pajaroellobacter abortibovis TaxID=1882918 RepID=A0A1L6MVH3_9BACT|nr:lasso peptide biosynthesis B2 protein [Pajaroellobacter abortibovis]APR99539.1 hypothetical protein BCY86_01720 [Pajaroellobacter abortibovis]